MKLVKAGEALLTEVQWRPLVEMWGPDVLWALGEGAQATVFPLLPVVLGQHRGFWLTADFPDALASALHGPLMEKIVENGGSFVVLPPQWPQENPLPQGWKAQLLHRRIIQRDIKPNLRAVAQVDTTTASRWHQLHQKGGPERLVTPQQSVYPRLLRQFYACGATFLEMPRAHGVYFKKENTLYFTEFIADDMPAAELLLQAARNHASCFEAQVSLPDFSDLFLGEGVRQYGALLCGLETLFQREPFVLPWFY